MNLVDFISRSFRLNRHLSNDANEIILLTYHGVVDEITNQRLQRNFHTCNQFEAHIKFLKKNNFIFLNASELVFYILNPAEIKGRKMVCITFDDGYQNNLEAIKILNKFNVSGTFFISSEAIDSEVSIWTVNLSLLLLEGTAQKLNFNNQDFSLNTYEERLLAFNEIRNYLKKCNSEQRVQLFDQIMAQFPNQELQKLMQQHNYFKMLTWDEIRQVQSDNIQFHSHGHSHEIHHLMQDESTISSEIEKSKTVIETNLNTNVFLFAYPNGNYNPISDDYLMKSNYKAAFVLGEKKYTCNDEVFSIPRITPNGKLEKFKNQIIP